MLFPHALFLIFKLVIISIHQYPKQSRYLLLLLKFKFYHSKLFLLQLLHYGLFKVLMLILKKLHFIHPFFLPKHYYYIYFGFKKASIYFHRLNLNLFTHYFISINSLLHQFLTPYIYHVCLFRRKIFFRSHY